MSCSSSSHAALKLNAMAWSEAEYVGRQNVPARPGANDAYVLEMRNCPACGSTLGVRVGEDALKSTSSSEVA